MLLLVLVAVLAYVRRVRRRRAFMRAAFKLRKSGPAWGHPHLR